MTDHPKSSPPSHRKKTYTEESVQTLISSPRFVVAADAYGANRCTLAQMLKLAFTEPPYIPFDLDPLVFADLVLNVVKRIHAGEIQIDDDWKREFADFYIDRLKGAPPL